MVNRLAGEKSPYLLQHQHNPVDWYPWGDEAFVRARCDDKPIFLSVGYSTCHWCHVMEHESFEDPRIAAVLNEHFVSIKVDREERPDVDRVYMTFVQATTGSGGWPMSVWLSPALEPFYGGTYYPPTSRWGRPGFVEVLQEIARVWKEDRPRVLGSAAAMVERLRTLRTEMPGRSVPGSAVLEAGVTSLTASFDARHGGFGAAPKFPRPAELLFLLREHSRSAVPEALAMVRRTLHAMADGGMRDQVGGGFHRYSVDAAWRVPHFEKMLYDQAQIVLACTEAAIACQDEDLAAVAIDTLDYVLRDLTNPAGGFYSAEDADSVPADSNDAAAPRKEGAFYVWSAAEWRDALGASADLAADLAAARFGVEADGNAPHDPHGEFTGRNLLYVARTIEELAERFSMTPDAVIASLAAARARLFAARTGRPRPHLDDKVLTAWNGLMIAACARAHRLLGLDTRFQDHYLDAARRAARFVLKRSWDSNRERLLRRFRDGEAAIDGYAEDYAFFVFGLLELFQADGDPSWLAWAVRLQDRQDDLFWDEATGGWFSTTGDDPSVLLRLKDDQDGAEPAASSIAVLNLLTLSHLVSDEARVSRWSERLERTLAFFGGRAAQVSRAVPMMLTALSTYHAGVSQIVIVGDRRGNARHLHEVARRHFLPSAIVVPVSPETAAAVQEPWIDALVGTTREPTAFVCRQFTCNLPARTAADLDAQLAATARAGKAE